MDTNLLPMLRDAGLAGVIALMAWWAMKEVFKRIDRALDQMQEVINKIDGGFALVRDNSTAQALGIKELINARHAEIMSKLGDRI